MVAISFKWILACFVAMIPFYQVLMVIALLFGGLFASFAALMSQ